MIPIGLFCKFALIHVASHPSKRRHLLVDKRHSFAAAILGRHTFCITFKLFTVVVVVDFL